MKIKFIYSLLFLFWNFSVILYSQNSRSDSIQKVYLSQLHQPSTLQNDTMLLGTLYELAWELRISGKFDSAAASAKKLQHLSQNKIDSAKTPEIKYRYKKYLVDGYNAEGLIDDNNGKFPQALAAFFKALQICDEIGNDAEKAVTCNNIGNIYIGQNNFSDALKYYTLAIPLEKSTGNSQALAASYTNIGIICAESGKMDEALEKFKNALEIDISIGYPPYIASAYSNLGDLYYMQGDYKNSLENMFAAIKIKEESGDSAHLADAYNNAGNIYAAEKDFKHAIANCSKGLMIATRLHQKEWIMNSYKGLAAVYDSMAVKGIGGNDSWKKSFDNYKNYIFYRDSLNNEENTKKSTQAEMQYQFNKKTATDSIRNAEQNKQEVLKHNQEIQQQKVYTYGGAIGFALMLVVAGISFRAYRNKRTANEIISLQKLLVEEKQKEILDSIHYAKRIQQALLPTEKYIEKNLERIKKS